MIDIHIFFSSEITDILFIGEYNNVALSALTLVQALMEIIILGIDLEKFEHQFIMYSRRQEGLIRGGPGDALLAMLLIKFENHFNTTGLS